MTLMIEFASTVEIVTLCAEIYSNRRSTLAVIFFHESWLLEGQSQCPLYRLG